MELLDKNEKQISKRDIVTIRNNHFKHGNFHFQGIVVEVEENIFNTNCSIAVYFYSEVYSYCIENQNSNLGIEYKKIHWFEENDGKCPEILLVSETWKECRQVTFFKPEDLIVENYWSEKTLVKRLNPYSCNIFYILKDPFIPNKTKCWIKGCSTISTDLGSINVHGTIDFIHVCPNCYKEYKSFWADSCPELEIK